MDDLTRNETAYYSYLFSLNYNKDDLELAFSSSKLGSEYFLDKWQGYIDSGRTYTLAYFDLFFALDPEHIDMLLNYVFNKYQETISRARFWSDKTTNIGQK